MNEAERQAADTAKRFEDVNNRLDTISKRIDGHTDTLKAVYARLARLETAISAGEIERQADIEATRLRVSSKGPGERMHTRNVARGLVGLMMAKGLIIREDAGALDEVLDDNSEGQNLSLTAVEICDKLVAKGAAPSHPRVKLSI